MVLNHILLHYRVNNGLSLISNQDKDYMAVYRNLEAVKETICNDSDEIKAYFLRLSERVLADRIRMMKTIDSYSGLYNVLHEYGLRKLGFCLRSFSNTKEGIRLKGIYENSLTEDLFFCKQKLLKERIINDEVFGLPEIGFQKKDVCKIILYGAGNVGKDYFRQIINRTDLEICAWMDRNYEAIGFPVSSPYDIGKYEYDMVLIAVNDEKSVSGIINELIQIGVDKNKLFWESPRIIMT